MPRAITAVARRLAAGNGFDRLSPEQRRAAWSAALRTHVLLLPVTLAFVALAPKLRPAFGTYVFVQFLFALVLAKVAEGACAVSELVKGSPPRFVANGWFFAFSVSLLPLLVVSFSLWSLP